MSTTGRAGRRTGRTTPSVVGLALLLALATACTSESAAAPRAPATTPSTTTTVARATTSTAKPNAGLAPPKVPSGGAYFGTWRGPGPGRPNDPKINIRQAEASIGRRYAIDHQYYQWGDIIPNEYQTWTVSQHRIPMLSLCACLFSGSVVQWARIAAGKEDPYLVSIARGFVALHSPAFLVFDAEPETNVGIRGSAADYVAAFRHAVSVFRAQKATNVAFVWATTAYAWQSGSGQNSLVRMTYPGANYADWIGLDPYNFDTNGQWHTLSYEVSPWYSWAKEFHPTAPLMLSEWGSKEDPNLPRRKSAWFRDALTALSTKYVDVHAVVYFDERKEEHGTVNDWRIDTSTTSLSAFAQIATASWFQAAA